MPTYQDEKGKWYFRVYVDDIFGNRKQKQGSGFATKKEAQKAERELVMLGVVGECNMTFEELWNQYDEFIKLKQKSQSYRKTVSKVKNHLLPYFKDYKVKSINATVYTKWQSEIMKKGFKYKYNSSIHGAMVTILNHAIKFYGLKDNIASKVGNFAKGNELPTQFEIWDYEEYSQFIKVVDDDVYKMFFETLYYTGLRQGECLALTWNDLKKDYLDRIRESVVSADKLKDIKDIMEYFSDSKYISKSYISELDTSTGIVTVKLESTEELYRDTLSKAMGDLQANKAGILKMFMEFSEGRNETQAMKDALKMARNTGYGIVYPDLKDMKLDTPEIIKQGSRYGVKLKAVASSIHLIKVDVESVFEPIIGSEVQSKELIDYLMKDYETDPTSIWKSEIFGRSLDVIVKEGIQAKLSLMPDNTRFKLANTITKIVNKGSNNLIAIVI